MLRCAKARCGELVADVVVMLRNCLVIALVVFMAPVLGATDDVRELTRQIDQHIEARQRSEGVTPSAIASDYAFARRATLDLAGRVPTRHELMAFVDSTEREKREAFVDGLLDAPDFAYHLRNTLDALLLAPHAQDNAWREYLLEATRENRSWDRVFKEIMLPERERPQDKRPAAFLRARAKDIDAMTNDASALLFGVNISCAKCHDHPLVGDWEQQHYFGLASFFQRTYPTRGGFVSEKFDGRMKFTSVGGDEFQAEFMFLTGASVSEPEWSLDKEAKKEIKARIRDAERKDDAARPPLPDFSPRAELVRLALASEGVDFFARNIVNRIWAQLLGRGLVHPLDQMHSENPPSHPQVLDALAADFVAHGYDLKRLIRAIVLTRAYARSSVWDSAAEPPPAEWFARGLVRPLTPWQLSLSLRVASRKPEGLLGRSLPNWDERRGQLEDQAAGFTSHLPAVSDGFQVGTDEALFFNNSAAFYKEFVSRKNGQLVSWLHEMGDPDKVVENAFLAVVSRPPSPLERGAMALHLAQRADRTVEATEQLVWTLLASPEFRFNH